MDEIIKYETNVQKLKLKNHTERKNAESPCLIREETMKANKCRTNSEENIVIGIWDK